MRGVGTDGALTMVGCNNGVVARLKRIVPSVIGVHCAAHCLNLASSQAGNVVPYIKKFNSILRQIYDFFDNSAVYIAGLESVQTSLHEKGRLVASSTTRWLSVYQSVNRLKSWFSSVVVCLGEERSDATAVGLAKFVCEYRFVCTMLLLCDTLPHVSHLSKCFQVDYSIIPRMVSSTLTSLQQLITSKGSNLSGLQSFLDKIQQEGIKIKKPAHLAQDYFRCSIREQYLTHLINNIENRFDDKSVISAFDIFNPAKLSDDTKEVSTLMNGADIDNFLRKAVVKWNIQMLLMTYVLILQLVAFSLTWVLWPRSARLYQFTQQMSRELSHNSTLSRQGPEIEWRKNTRLSTKDSHRRSTCWAISCKKSCWTLGQ